MPASPNLQSPKRGVSLAIAAVSTLVAVTAEVRAQDGKRDLSYTRPVNPASPGGPSIDDIIAHRTDTDSSRIVGGTAAAQGQWPSLVAIYAKESGRSRNFCGGTVIGREWVLTAAHCAASMKRAPASTSFFIREGTIDLNRPGGRDIKVSEILTYDRYDPNLTLNDIALLKLAGQTSAPRQKLAGREEMAAALKPGRSSTVAGFGVTSVGGSTSAQLLQVDVPIVEHSECRRIYGSNKITEASFCAGLQKGGKDSCQGDSGGPLFVPRSDGEQMQIGIVSWGRGCAEAGYPGVYASVGHFQDWIRSRVLDVTFTQPSAPGSPTQASVAPLTAGASETGKPSQLAQVTLEIVEGDTLKVGSFIEVRVTSSVRGAVVVYNENPDGRGYQLYPSKAFPAPGPNPALARIEPGRPLRIPSAAQRDAGYRFIIRPPTGTNTLRAVVVPESKTMGEIVAENFDGRGIRDLSLVTNQIVAAELEARGPEPIRIDPVDRGTAERIYRIVD